MMGITDWLDAHIIVALAEALIHSLWQGVLIISLLVVGDQLGIARSAERKYLFYMSGLIILFISSIASFLAFAYWPQEVQSRALLTPYNSLLVNEITTIPSSVAPFFWEGVLVIAWFAGFLFYGCKNVLGSMRLFQLRRNAHKAPMHWQRRVSEMSRAMHIRTKVMLLSTTEASIPFIMGVVRPVIMFPANYFVQLNPAQIEAILVHELTHIGRNDYLLNIVQIVIESLLFFNPATWWLSKQIRQQREYCCDDRVQSNMNDQKTYLEALYHVARISSKQPASAVALFDNNSELIMRMKRMSSKSQPHKSLRSLIMASIGLFTVFGLLAFNTLENSNEEYGFETYNPSVVPALPYDLSVDLYKQLDIDPTLLNVKLNAIHIAKRHATQLDVEKTSHEQSYYENSAPYLAQPIASDTNPPSAKMLELQAAMEEISEEMEEISEEMEELIEETVEVELEKIELLAEEMELIAEKYETEIEDSPEMERLEELSELLEEEMEKLEESMEELGEGSMEELEELMETKSKKYEEYDSLTEEEREKLAEEMQTLSKELHAASKEMSDQYMLLMDNPEIKELQLEMENLSKEMSQKQMDMQPMNEEMQKLQAEMQVQQQLMQEKMHGAVQEMQHALQLKAKEMQMLQIELQQEMQRWQAEQKKDN